VLAKTSLPTQFPQVVALLSIHEPGAANLTPPKWCHRQLWGTANGVPPSSVTDRGERVRVSNHSVLPWAPVAFVLYLAAVIITLAVNVPLNDAIKAAGNPDGVDDLDTARCPDLENPVVVGTAWTAMSARRSRRPEGMSWRVGAAPQAQAQQAAGEKRESSEQGGESGHDGRADPVGLCRGTADIGDGDNRACAGTVGCRGLCRDGDAVLGVRLARSVRCQSRPQGCGTWRSGRPGTGQRGRCRARRLAGSRAARGRLGTWRG
jgi:hypothetical protein